MAGNWPEAERAYGFLKKHYPQQIPEEYQEIILKKRRDFRARVEMESDQRMVENLDHPL